MKSPFGKLSALSLTLLCTAIVGCVSVKFASTEPQKASGLNYQNPKGLFKKVDNPSVDVAWQNIHNGNTIAFLSECKDANDTPLRSMASENLAALSNPKILDSQEINFNDREALRTLVEGQVDGVGVRMNLVFFKKNGCDYTLSYVGRQKQFAQDQDNFNQFVESFKAP